MHLEPHPKGLMLIFGAFIFPTNLVARPLIAAIASGNVVCIKPSEHAAASEKYLLKLKGVLDPRIFAAFTGDPKVCEDLVEHK